LASKLDSIAAEVSRLENVYQQKVVGLAALKQSFLQQAFSGQLTASPWNSIREAAE
jgi:hypothetical protein